jgi:hypothetical protein
MSELEQFDDIFEDEVVEPQVEVVEEAAAEPEQASPETEPESEEVVAESKVETTATEKEPWTLSAVLDEREKRQKAVAEAEELRKKLAEYETPKDDVSIFEDEKGFVQRQKQETEVALRNTALNMSEAFAESVFGEEKVAAAKQWMITEGVKSPYALEQFNAAKLPYHAAVKLYEDDQVRRDPESYKAKLREEILAELKNEKPKSSTPSLASKRSVGEKHNVESFDDILGD